MSKSTDDLEMPAKVYQVDALSDQLNRVEILVQSLVSDAKNQVSAKYMEDRLVAITTAYDDKMLALKNEQTLRINALEEEVIRNSKGVNKFTWTVVAIGMGIVASAIGIVWFGK